MFIHRNRINTSISKAQTLFFMNAALIQKAHKRIQKNTLLTPLLYSRELSKIVSGNVYLKLESEQHTGSFKARGSLNKIMSLSDAERHQGTVTASTGNHGLGFARACEISGAKGIVFLPQKAAQSKIDALGFYDVELKFHEGSSLDTEIFAKQFADENGKTWVSPYNDLEIIAGQGTIGIELMTQLEGIDNICATVGGGGLISGIASYVKDADSDIAVIGCQPVNSPEMSLSVEKGEITNLPTFIPTLSDGSAGGIEDGSITFPICQSLIDDFILIKEEDIEKAIRFVAHTHHRIIEGAAGVSVAAVMTNKERFKGQHTVIIICGGNIDIELFKSII